MGSCGCKTYIEKINELCFPNNTTTNNTDNGILDKPNNNTLNSLNDINQNNYKDNTNFIRESDNKEQKPNEIKFKSIHNNNYVYNDFFDVDKYSNEDPNQVTLFPSIKQTKQAKNNIETNILMENDNNNNENNKEQLKFDESSDIIDNIPSFITKNDIKDIVNKINSIRKKHHSPDLLINKDLNNIAQLYANKLAEDNILEHSSSKYKNELLGENLYFSMNYSNDELVDYWYHKGDNYNYNKPDNNVSQFEEFTQLLWKSSVHIGIGVSKSKEGYFYGVANFYPAGNISNNYSGNVLSE